MQLLIYFIIFNLMLVSLLANPAPVSFEIADMVLMGLPFVLGLVCLAITTEYQMQRTEANLTAAVLLYLSYLLLSMWIGILHGVPFLNVLRSIGPYINFFPLLFLGFLPQSLLNPWRVAVIFILIGVLQGAYHLFLYFSHAGMAANALGVLRGRITLLEPRTTLPILLSVAVLPMAFMHEQQWRVRGMAWMLVLLGLLAGTVTLTRSIILSILMGVITFVVLFVYKQSYIATFSLARLLLRGAWVSLFIIVVLIAISCIPHIHTLEQGLLARFLNNSHLTASTDYTNGRLYDEWLPALNTWGHSGLFTLLFGIGAGNSFIVASGEERTYIHNLSIYSLVYGGVYGFIVTLWLYYTLLKTFVVRSLQTQQIIYIGFAALLSSLYCYGQLFAVHKGLAFNAMLFLMIALALHRPNPSIEGNLYVRH